MSGGDTFESARARSHRNYVRLKEQHRCVQCSCRLAPEERFVRCVPCRGVNHKDTGSPSRYDAKVARFQAQLARVIETSKTMTVEQQAQDLGVPSVRIYALRNRARRISVNFPRERGGAPHGRSNRESPRWSELDSSQPCSRCGLRGEHVCLHGDAAARRGPGGIYPEGG